MTTPKPKGVFDVAKPGKKIPDATSRPIIVGHTTVTHDPMVSDDKPQASADSAASEKAKPHNEMVVQPPTHTEEKTGEKTAPASAEADDKDDTKEQAESTKSSEGSDSAAVGAVADQAASQKKKLDDEAKEKEAQARRDYVAGLVADKTYFLPIGQATRKKNTRNSLMVIVLILLLLAAGGYAAYTMGFLKSLKIGH